MSIFSKWWPRWRLVVELRWPTKTTSITPATQSGQEKRSMRYQTCRLHLHYTSFKVIMSPHLPGNLVLTLLNITIKLSLIEIMAVPKDSVLMMSHSPLHCMLSWAVCNYSSWFYSDNAKIISIKQLKSTGKLLTIQLEDLVTPVHS